jgi:peptide/nickel transport system substrate-binding protein
MNPEDFFRQLAARDTMSRKEILRRAGLGAAALALPSMVRVKNAGSATTEPLLANRVLGNEASDVVLRIGDATTIQSITPFNTFQGDFWWFFYPQIYPYLVRYDYDAKTFMPDFAKSWSHSADGKVWTFKLASKGTWSDGTPVTAKDAEWTLNTIIRYASGGAAAFATWVAGMRSVRALNNTTLRITYTSAHSPSFTLFLLQGLPVLPKHIWSEWATGKQGARLKSAPYNPPIVSGGPFVWTKYSTNQFALLERHAGFYGPKARLSGVGVQIFADQQGVLRAIEHNEVDVLMFQLLPTPGIVPSLRAKGLNVVQKAGGSIVYFTFNSNPKKPKHRELLKPEVRLAIRHAMNVEKVVRVAYGGYAEAAITMLPKELAPWHNTRLKPVKFDIAAANKLLDAAGYTRGSDGVRRADGERMEYDVLCPNWAASLYGRILSIFQADWDHIGIKAHLKPLDPAALFAAITAPNNKYLSYDWAMWNWEYDPDPDQILGVFLRSQWGVSNDSGYSNRAYASAWQRQHNSQNDADRRRAIWELQSIVYTDQPWIPIVFPNWISVNSKKWQGFRMTPRGQLLGNGKGSLMNVRRTK